MQENPNAPKIVEFGGTRFHLGFARYGNGRTALTLECPKTGMQEITATVNVPEAPLLPNQLLVKDYSEQQGMLTALERAGIVKATGATVQSGFVDIPVCELLIDSPWTKECSVKTPPLSPDREPEMDLDR